MTSIYINAHTSHARYEVTAVSLLNDFLHGISEGACGMAVSQWPCETDIYKRIIEVGLPVIMYVDTSMIIIMSGIYSSTEPKLFGDVPFESW